MNQLSNILLLLFFIVSCKPQNQNSKVNSEESQTYKRIMGNKTWGFVNQNGETIIPLNKYKFLNPINDEGMIFAQLINGKFGFINIHQDTLISFKYDDLGVFAKGLAPAKFNGKYGYINRQGKVIIPFKYETETYFYNSGLAIAKRNKKYGFINKDGEEVIPIEYEKVDQSMTDTLVLVSRGGKWAFYSNNGDRKTDFKYDKVIETYIKVDDRDKSSIFGNGLALVKKNYQTAYLNSNLKEVVPFGTYDIAEPFQNNLAIVAKNGRYGIIDRFGNLTLSLKYDLIEHPKEYSNQSELFVIKKNNKLQLLNKVIEPITEFNITEYEWDSYRDEKKHHRYFILKNDLGLVGTVSEKGNQQIPFSYQDIKPFDGKPVAIAKQKGKYGLIDFNNRVVYPFENKQIRTNRFFKFFIVNKFGKFGMIDNIGQVILPFNYENIEPCFYDKDKRFIVKKDNLHGVIDINKKVIIPIEYDEISNWVEYGPDEHFLTKNGKKGLISREGKVVIPPVYDEILVDNSKLIKVEKNGLFGTINWKNEIVHPIEYEQILWEWPYLTNKALDTVYLKKNGTYFSTDTTGKVLEQKISKKVIDEKFGY